VLVPAPSWSPRLRRRPAPPWRPAEPLRSPERARSGSGPCCCAFLFLPAFLKERRRRWSGSGPAKGSLCAGHPPSASARRVPGHAMRHLSQTSCWVLHPASTHGPVPTHPKRPELITLAPFAAVPVCRGTGRPSLHPAAKPNPCTGACLHRARAGGPVPVCTRARSCPYLYPAGQGRRPVPPRRTSGADRKWDERPDTCRREPVSEADQEVRGRRTIQSGHIPLRKP
jgi:hypothetical protein